MMYKLIYCLLTLSSSLVAMEQKITTWFDIPQDHVIKFYTRGQPHYEFTNFYVSPITLDGKRWPTVEHYFQAQKFTGHPKIQEEILKNNEPSHALKVARANAKLTRGDWHIGYKYEVMAKALMAKFTQHQDLRDMLLATGNKILIEDTRRLIIDNPSASPKNVDEFWGAGKEGRGANDLGKLLMFVRHKLRHGAIDPQVNYKDFLQLTSARAEERYQAAEMIEQWMKTEPTKKEEYSWNDIPKDHVIKFYDRDYDRDKDYFEFTNFHESGVIILDGQWWHTPEHYYQAQKTIDQKMQAQIREAANAHTAKELGRRVTLRPDWEKIKFGIMLKVLWAKFTSYDYLRDMLLNTGNKILMEDSLDPIWGIGHDGHGENMFGKILMFVRHALRIGTMNIDAMDMRYLSTTPLEFEKQYEEAQTKPEPKKIIDHAAALRQLFNDFVGFMGSL